MTMTQIADHEDLGHDVARLWLDDRRMMVLQMPKGARRKAIEFGSIR